MTPAARHRPAADHGVGSFERVTAALEKVVGEGRPAGAWVKYNCPVHEAEPGRHDPSLIVRHFADVGRTKISCRAGCDDREILARLDLEVRDLYDNPVRRRRDYQRQVVRRPQPRQVTRADRAIDAAGLPLTKPAKDLGQQRSGWRKVAAYSYVRADGTVAGEVVRREAAFEHGRKKRFHQHHWDPQTGRMVDGGFEAIPYNLPGVMDAVAAGRTVYIAEGEKDADTAAARAGLVATTNAGGALNWTDEHSRWLYGAAEVVIVCDRDAPGYRRADRILTSLAGHVGRIRVVQAATGKDLTEHFDAGHGVDELTPIPFLDPATPGLLTTAPANTLDQVAASAGVVSPVAGPSPELTNTPDGGPTMATSWHNVDGPTHHDDTVDHLGSQFSQVVRALMQEIMQLAMRLADERRRQAEEARRESEQAQREFEAAQAAERKATEIRLSKLREHGWDRLSRSEIASALRDAASWSEQSETAKRMVGELAGHIRGRYGVHIDPTSGHVTVDTPDLVGQLAAIEKDRAAAARVRTAQDRMVEMVGAEDIDESKKAALYADISTWQRNPSGHNLGELTKKMEAAGVPEKTRTKIRFVGVYLGTPDGTEVPVADRAATALVTPVAELRRLGEPLVDPAEECKPRVDAMLQRYQDRLRHGVDTRTVQDQLAEAVAVMTDEDREIARARGTAIRRNPAAEFKPLWPDHVDRDELGEKIRMYASLAPQVEARITQDDGVDAAWSTSQRERTIKLGADIDKALTKGKGLHRLEKDQIRAVIAAVEAGDSVVPDMLWADDRSAAAIDRDRADEIGRSVAAGHRRQLEEILSSSAVPAEAARAAREEVAALVGHETSLAAGRISLGDYERSGADDHLLAKLSAAGVSEPMRNRVRNHLDEAISDSAITGKQAARIAARWADRRELVAAGRAPAVAAYDSAERRTDLQAGLESAGLDPDEIAQRMAADAGRARPLSAAVRHTPGETPGRPHRTTTPGQGVHRINHRGKGEPGLGR
ncbi:hypothetical protein [Nocardia sp. NPDC051570]|uniref:hypothetical protein n=1 Tax=Nocardia sp. NPDC051570 TaxID=3364324 RepID=UPI003796BF11